MKADTSTSNRTGSVSADKSLDATPVSAEPRWSREQIAQWRSTGFTFVSGLLPGSLIEALHAESRSKFPDPGTPESNNISGFGSGGRLTFPSAVTSLNAVTLHPRLLRAVADLLGEEICDLRLTQSDLWPKYGRPERRGELDNTDQRIHIDYPNHTLAHPPPWDRPEAVELIVYLSDSAETGGYTAVVPREGPDDPAYRWPIVDSPGIGDLRYVNDAESAEAYFAELRPGLAEWRRTLYARERHAAFRLGDVLFYRHDTWHRGTPMHDGALRLVQNITFRKASSEWISTLHVGWAWKAYRDDKLLEKLIATSSLDQRAVLGFPQPGSSYWCTETLAAIEARYGMFGFDARPYREAI